MRSLSWAVTAIVAAWSPALVAAREEPLSSRQILPANFKPPQVFKNTNLVRSINLEKGYVKESVNVEIQNIDSKPQQDYYIVFDANTISKVGGLQVKDKNDASKPAFAVELIELDVSSPTQFYKVKLAEPLAPSAQTSLAISFHILSSLSPLPAKIAQADKQYLQFKFSEYYPSAYESTKQKTKLKFPTTAITDYTGKPERQGSTYTYGPFEKIPAGTESEALVRYEFTKPLIHAESLERDIEISHWGGNAAFEERYQLTNKGAALSSQFSRLQWAQSFAYSQQVGPSSAIPYLIVPLKAGSVNPYFIDDIGNVSTSSWRSTKTSARLDLKPRYPIFGGWRFPFKIGWDANLSNFLRRVGSEGYILNVPFLEGPQMPEGVSYEKITLRVILPEGAFNVRYKSPVPLAVETQTVHKTFMDTVGRTTLELTAFNVIDESRDHSLIVTYDYSATAGLRKPLTIAAGILVVFVTAWGIGGLDNSIGRKK